MKNVIRKFRYVIIAILAVLAGLLVELKGNLAVMRQPEANKGDIALALDTLEYTDMTLEDGKLVVSGTAPEIIIRKDASYVSKLKYEYDASGSVSAKIYVKTGETETGETFSDYDDSNNMYTRTSVNKIYSNADCIKLVFEPAEDLAIKSISIYNVITFNWRRFVVICASVFCVLFLLVCHKEFVLKPENVFVVLATLIGMSYILVVPAQKVGWDECYHFEQAYSLFSHKDTGALIDVYEDDTKVWPLNMPQTFEEYSYQNDYVSQAAKGDITTKGSFSLARLVGYIAPAIAIELGYLFNMPFADIFVMGKFFSMALYIALVYIAIKKLPVGKPLMTVLALLPTPMFMPAIYNRDSVIIACAFLAFAYLFYELFSEENISWKNYMIIVASLGVVCILKAVYAPLILLVLFLPKRKFKDAKTMYIMKFGMLAVCAILIAVNILPTLIHPSDSGDSRGLGAVGDSTLTISSGQQLSFILHNPISYVLIFLRSFMGCLYSFTLGADAWGTLGHYGVGIGAEWIALILVCAYVLTQKGKRVLPMSNRIVLLVLLAVSVALIWTALYMSFTPVGNAYIFGVQGRYYIPLMFPLIMLFNTERIKIDFDENVSMRVLIMLPVLLNFIMIYKNIIQIYCI